MYIYFFVFALACMLACVAGEYYKKYLRAPALSTELPVCIKSKDSRIEWKRKIVYAALFVAALLPIFILSGIRYDVGTDYFYTYVPEFNASLNGAWPYTEAGFNLLIKIIQLFTRDYVWLFIVTSFFFTYFLLRTVIRHSENIFLSFVVIFLSCFYFWSLNNVRQAIAAVIVFAGVDCLYSENIFKYFRYVLAGMLFHYSAVIMIFPYLFLYFKKIRKNYLLSLLILIILTPLICKIFEFLVSFTRYKYFFDSEFNNQKPIYINIIYGFFFFWPAYYVLRDRIQKDTVSYVLLSMQFLYFWIGCVSLFIQISEMILRLSFYFLIFQALLIPHCYKVLKGKEKLFLLGYILLYGVYMYYYIVMKEYYDVLPYQTIFGR